MFLSNELDVNKHLTISLLSKAKSHLALKSFKAQVDFSVYLVTHFEFSNVNI